MSRPASPIQRTVLWSLVGITLAIRLAVALADHRSLIATDVYQDDAFYYFKIASNVAQGRGMTFDGVIGTNGFQPLYLLLLVPIMKALGGDLVAPLHAAGVMLALVAAATAIAVYALTRSLSGPRTALVAVGLWAVSPYFVVHGTNGQETGLALFFVVALPLAYVRWFREPSCGTPRRAVLFGVLVGLGVLARLDTLLLVAALGVDWLVTGWRGRTLGRVGRHATLAAAVAFSTWLPWGVASRAATGTWLPQSGAASREIALNYGWANLEPIWSSVDKEDPLFDPTDVPRSWYADVGSKHAFVLLLESPLLAPLRAGEPFGVWPRLESYAPYRWFRSSPAWGTAVALLMLAGAAAVAWRWPRPPGDGPGIGFVAAVFLVLCWLGYTFHSPSHWYSSRYLSGAILLTTIAALAGVHARLGAGSGRAGATLRPLVVLALVAIFAVQLDNYRASEEAGRLLRELRWSDAEPGGFLREWCRLEPSIDRTKVLGTFQAGIYGYFSGLEVVNLDGKVNPDAMRALRERSLDRYIAERGVEYVLDWDWVFYALCRRHVQRPAPVAFRPIVRGRTPLEPSLYGVVRRE